MRRRYVVSYDVSDPKRLRRTFKTMRGYGEHIQLSMFECLLNDVELVSMRDDLREAINAREDQVLVIDLGIAESEAPVRITSLGRPYRPRTLGPVVV